MPLKREDLRKRAEEKAAELAAEGIELHPVTASGRNLAKKFWKGMDEEPVRVRGVRDAAGPRPDLPALWLCSGP